MKPGDEILSCEPFAHVVSKSLNGSICDSCLRKPKKVELKKCTGCRYVYYCGRECQRTCWPNHRDECTYLKAVSPKIPTDTVRLMARIIIKLRNGGSRLIANLPDGSKRRFDDLMSHRKEIIGDDNRMEAFDAFFGVLQECFESLGGIPPKGEVLDLYGRVTVNSFNLMNDEYQSVGIGLYLEASAFDHSCRPNATVAFDGKKILIRCIEEVREVADVRISYCHLLYNRERRRKDLKEQYYFDCECEECSDENSDAEALKKACMRCPKCSEGIAMKESEREELVKCFNCDQDVPENHVKSYWSLREQVIDTIYHNEGKHPEPMEQSYEFLVEMEPLFYPTERYYLELLEHCFETYINQNTWQKALSTGKELLLAYRKLYPKYDVNTALMAFKVAKLANYLELTDAHAFICEAEKLFLVCYGPKHPLTENVRVEKQEIELFLKFSEKDSEEKVAIAQSSPSG